jgi:hypothetical protein
LVQKGKEEENLYFAERKIHNQTKKGELASMRRDAKIQRK